uniref:Uncharacterized protein n=1 Tax=Amphilophus citrinellus TaxID=61819 RepID=A0A3Q0STD2_AMPCI
QRPALHVKLQRPCQTTVRIFNINAAFVLTADFCCVTTVMLLLHSCFSTSMFQYIHVSVHPCFSTSMFQYIHLFNFFFIYIFYIYFICDNIWCLLKTNMFFFFYIFPHLQELSDHF